MNRLDERLVKGLDKCGIKELTQILQQTFDRGGNVVIPSFAVGRTQELIYQFNMFYEQHPEYQAELEKVNVYIDSPMATTTTEVFKKNAQVFDAETKNYELYIGNESSSGEKHNIESTKEIGKIVEGYIEDQLHFEGLPIY